ncbi:SH3 domain protein [Necator americanus]|uniref:SH3 domain protein n=1 Tax=Necator americanus TaxID=51031 RepID=W2TRD1_NECAM|nr:SH3 domain protein [Necator americanus]ETN83592.1 SH3 domain protein [Necator americanus]
MTLNFQKHGAAIQAAYDRIATSKTNDEWVILDYEGNSNVIKIGEEGDYGLEEFSTSFNSGRLQYGVIGVRLAKSALTKIVLVHWQGEGVPSARVASTTSHVDDVRRFLKSVHVIHYARSEIDVEPEVIRKEVAKLPATYATTAADTYYTAPTVVGSVYKPIKPHTDINIKERDEFWEKLNREEKSSKKSEEMSRIEERKRKESAEREAREVQRLAEEKQHREEQERRAAELRKKNDVKQHHVPTASAPVPSSMKSNSLEKPHRTIVTGPSKLNSDRLGMFERKDEKLPSPTRTIYVNNQAPKKTEVFHPSASPVLSSSGTVSPSHDSVSSAGLSSFHSPNDSGYEASASESPKPSETHIPPGPQTFISVNDTHSLQNHYYEEPPVEEPQIIHSNPTPSKFPQYDEPPGDICTGLRAIALWDYQAADSTEISFDPDDYITEIDQVDPGWWRGRGPNGNVGLFPANYVKLI